MHIETELFYIVQPNIKRHLELWIFINLGSLQNRTQFWLHNWQEDSCEHLTASTLRQDCKMTVKGWNSLRSVASAINCREHLVHCGSYYCNEFPERHWQYKIVNVANMCPCQLWHLSTSLMFNEAYSNFLCCLPLTWHRLPKWSSSDDQQCDTYSFI